MFGKIFVFYIILAAIGLLLEVICAYGVFKEKEKFIIPKLIFDPIARIIGLVDAIVELMVYGWVQPYIKMFGHSTMGIAIGFVIWKVFWSYRKQIIAGEEENRAEDNLAKI